MVFPVLSQSSMRAYCAVAILLCPFTARADQPLAQRLREAGAMARFVPDQASSRLRDMEWEMATAPTSLRTDFLYFYSTAERGTGDLTHALTLADQLINYGKRNNDNVALAKGLIGRANTLYLREDLAASHATSFEAERVARTTADIPTTVLATIAAGQSFQEEGNYPAALAKLHAAVGMARQIGTDTAPLASALHALVQLYLNLGELDKGWEVQRESLAVARKMASPGYVATALGDEYALAVEQNAFERARHALFEELGLERSMGARQMGATTLVNLSDCYLKEGRFREAEAYAAQALDAAVDVRSNNDIATARVNLGQALLGQGRLAEGKRQFEAGLATYERQGDKPELLAVLREYGRALEHAGDYKGAVDAYDRERGLSGEIFAGERQKAVMELQQKYDAEKKQRRIDALRQENRAARAELDNRRWQQRVWWLLAVACALATVVVGLLYRKVRRANTALEEKNLQLKRQGALDPLTLLYNRRHFQEFMARAGNERRTGVDATAGALFLLDVDHFKDVNDTLGHAAGDAVLKTVAHDLRAALRDTDMIVRWGGEEFLAFVPAVAHDDLDEVALRILHGISAQAVEYRNGSVPVSVSVGYAPFPLALGGTALTWEQVVNLADMAMLLAKSHGRNRAYGVRGFPGAVHASLDAIERDLEQAWRAGWVDLSVVRGGGEAPVRARV
ncbi:tetratricopeptide repeat-containing diguanylate cyclase [Massilia luteola]|uniref:tetratricopeptide repeat-containing diguanylate cyclase n=1 Tax=Massilia luteola TaxID=3081751 RepID=UPI002ACC3764|nr:tetratricopeptide repeat-containing diguanylate cyclase [Massilia sp. Gc5]